jgi:HlyD family secretion protein
MSRTPRTPSRARKLLSFRNVAIAAIVVALAAAGLWYWRHRQAATDEGAYRTAAVEQGDIRVAISSTGTLSAIHTVTVGSQISGQVIDVRVDYNSKVKKGDVLARIDPATYKAQYEQTSAQIASAKATLANAELVYNRDVELAKKQLVAQADVDAARAARDAARAAVAQQTASLKNIQVNIDRSVITSPVDGVVLTRSIDPGQTVAASLQAPTLFTIAEDLSKMQIQLAVDESDIGQVKPGQTVSFTADAFPDRKFKGVVDQVRLAATTTSNVVTYPVIVTVDNGDGTLLPGLTVNAEIEVNQRENVLKVSNAALRYKPTDNALPPAPLAGGQRTGQASGAAAGGGRGGGMLEDLTRAAAGLKLNPAQQAAFDAAIGAVRERQKARQTQSQGGGFGPPGGMVVIGGGGNNANLMAQVRQRMAERFKEDFAAFRDSLDDAQKPQWDAALAALLNAKRTTLYRLVDGKPQPVMVRVGVSDGTDTEISGGGLKAGDLLVTGERRAQQ